jgi:hypothetical protein
MRVTSVHGADRHAKRRALALTQKFCYFCADVVIGVFFTPIMAMSLDLTPLNAYFEAAFTIQYCVPL